MTTATMENNVQEQAATDTAAPLTAPKFAFGPDMGPRMQSDVTKSLKDTRWTAGTVVRITGIIGRPDTEHRMGFVQMFNPAMNPLYPEGLRAIADRLGLVITKANRHTFLEAFAELQAKIEASPLLDDQRETQEKHDADEARIAAALAKQKHERNEKADKRAQDSARLRSEHPDLELVEGSGKSARVVAASNIRRQLARAFPGVVFTVRSDSYSGGNHIDVGWTLGPLTDAVAAITNRYVEGSFDGMTDSYSYASTAWTDTFGGTKYLFNKRNEGKESVDIVTRAFCAAEGIAIPEPFEPWKLRKDDEFVDAIVREIIHGYPYPAGAVITGIEAVPPGSVSGEGRWAGIYRPRWTAPQEAPATPVEPVTGAAGASMTENREHQGIELRFPSKPSADVIARLKAAKWRWAFRAKCWYHRDTPEARTFAAAIVAG